MKILLILTIIWNNNLTELNPKNVYDYCVEQDIKYPEIVTAQAIWETGWLKCKNCSLDRNNIFGFFYKGEYIQFNDWKDCVDYYKRWQDKFYDGERNYYDFLTCIYKDNNGNCIKYCVDPDTYNECLKKTIDIHINEWVAD